MSISSALPLAASLLEAGQKNYNIVIKLNGKDIITAAMPEEFQTAVSSDWSAPFAELGSGMAGALLGLAGISIKRTSTTVQLWDGTSPMSMTIPLDLVAQQDAGKEVVLPVIQLMQLAAPAVTPEGRFIPPGPAPIDLVKIWNNIAKDVNKGVGDKLFGLSLPQAGANSYLKGGHENVDITIGRFMQLKSVIVTGVRPNWQLLVDSYGQPMRVRVELEVETPFAPSKGYIEDMFQLPQVVTDNDPTTGKIPAPPI